jgi:hypothetical protein
VLEGSVRNAGGRVRITTRLVYALSGADLWADRFDGRLEGVFDLQDKVASSVAGIIEPALQAAEIRRAAERSTTDSSAYDLYLRALPHSALYEKDRMTQALDLLGRAIERVHATAPLSPWQPNVTTCSRLTIGQTSGKQTVAWASIWLNGHSGAPPDDPEVLPTVAFVLGYLGENIDVAIGSMDRALGLNPSFARGWAWSGILRG